MTGAVGEERTPPFFWITPDATKAIRSQREDTDPGLSQALAVYAALAEIGNEKRARSSVGEESGGFTAERARIARYAGTSTKTVDRVAVFLERISLLRIERERKRGDLNLPNRFWLTDPGGGDSQSLGGDSQSGGVATHSRPTTSRRTSNNQEVKTPEMIERDEVVQKVYGFWLSLDASKNPKEYRLTNKRRKGIEGRLDDSERTEIREALEGQWHDPWCQEVGKLDCEYPLRSRTLLEDFRDRRRHQLANAKTSGNSFEKFLSKEIAA